jgi:hypothetical protein
MLATRLVHLIESHADLLSQSLTSKLENDPRCPGLRKVSAHELRAQTYEVYRHLGDWLLGKTDQEVEHVYSRLGERRAAQGVALSHFLYAMMATKEHLWKFLEEEGMVARPVELFGEMELFRLVDEFYDRTLYFGAVGYERVQAAKAVATVSAA